jgi:hypothetical protein
MLIFGSRKFEQQTVVERAESILLLIHMQRVARVMLLYLWFDQFFQGETGKWLRAHFDGSFVQFIVVVVGTQDLHASFIGQILFVGILRQELALTGKNIIWILFKFDFCEFTPKLCRRCVTKIFLKYLISSL